MYIQQICIFKYVYSNVYSKKQICIANMHMYIQQINSVYYVFEGGGVFREQRSTTRMLTAINLDLEWSGRADL